MATNCTFKYQSAGPDGRGSEISAVVSLADVVVNTSPNSTGGWNTATVTADLQTSINLDAAAAASAGIPAGWYHKTGPAEFRRNRLPHV